ncbi:MAG: GNAT family N-acetyltransferase [Acidimicrobiia bacterium]|nr:GNAT family N-acetyltransferase [Acidimicrobiia bacterium]
MIAPVIRPAAGYPTELETSILLRDDRRLRVRPIVRGDAAVLRREFDNADEETLRLRFMTSRPHLDERRLLQLVDVDYRWRLALTAWDGQTPVAIARYEGKPNEPSAEVAFVVKPAYRNLGVASALLMLLEDAARRAGISEFTASFLGSNLATEAVLAKSGFGTPTIRNGVGEARKDLLS